MQTIDPTSFNFEKFNFEDKTENIGNIGAFIGLTILAIAGSLLLISNLSKYERAK
jgi:hypothetical protein